MGCSKPPAASLHPSGAGEDARSPRPSGKSASVPTQAVVLIHGRTVPGPVLFDLRDRATGGGGLSLQEALARAGIDTFAPSLLGYGRSTRFDEASTIPATRASGSMRTAPVHTPRGATAP